MFFKFFIPILIVFCSCAKPIYSNSNDSAPDNSIKEEKAECLHKFIKSTYCLSWTWEKKPLYNEYGQIVFKIFRLNNYDKTAIEIDLPNQLNLFLWMPDMNHGSAKTNTIKIDIGTYQSSNISLFMPGLWNLHFQILKGGEVQDEVIIPVLY